MAQTYDDIQQQIQRLQQRAQALRSSEVKEVVERIKVAIAHYELTAEQLGFGVGKRVATKGVAGKRASPVPGQKAVTSTIKAQFGDSQGNTWVGRGARPAWLRQALEAGHDINEFRIGRRAKSSNVTTNAMENNATAVSTSAVPPTSAPANPRKKKRVAKTQYSDGAGHVWSGFGPKPAWLKAAIESGKSLADFAT
jgi:DNA-binding protein H-NS